uniref:Uncharacterized protein n=1 Tax=Yersinia enterocolitica TaxID=630 RepID=B0RKN5_YEREN|nr:hypothetical protein [Yersinia enterocolitica]
MKCRASSLTIWGRFHVARSAHRPRCLVTVTPWHCVKKCWPPVMRNCRSICWPPKSQCYFPICLTCGNGC